MPVTTKAEPQLPINRIESSQSQNPTAKSIPLEPKLQKARELMGRGEYRKAIDSLPAAGSDLHARNASAVCMIREHQFERACDLLRTVVLNSQINRVRDDVPYYVAVNYAISLFYSGKPAGALDALNEIEREEDPEVQMLRGEMRRWVAGMSLLRRLDWKLNRVAPKGTIAPPSQPMGRCVWDFA